MSFAGVHDQVLADVVVEQTALAAEQIVPVAQTRIEGPSPVLAPPNVGLVALVTPPVGCVSVGRVSAANVTGFDTGPLLPFACKTVAVIEYEPSAGRLMKLLHCQVWFAAARPVQLTTKLFGPVIVAVIAVPAGTLLPSESCSAPAGLTL